jgi:hypothetical protein
MISQPAHGKQIGTGEESLAIVGSQPQARLELVGNIKKTGMGEARTREHKKF